MPANGQPARINLAALRAVASERAATTSTRQPRSCSSRPRARPTRPAPRMARVFGIHVRMPRGWPSTPIRMHFFWLVLFGLIALFWSTYGLKVAYGALQLPWLKDCAPAADADCLRISVLFAARDEEKKLPAALATLVAVDYPNLEIVAVDDRSTDRKSTRLNSSHTVISYAVFCLKKNNNLPM